MQAAYDRRILKSKVVRDCEKGLSADCRSFQQPFAEVRRGFSERSARLFFSRHGIQQRVDNIV